MYFRMYILYVCIVVYDSITIRKDIYQREKCIHFVSIVIYIYKYTYIISLTYIIVSYLLQKYNYGVIIFLFGDL